MGSRISREPSASGRRMGPPHPHPRGRRRRCLAPALTTAPAPQVLPTDELAEPKKSHRQSHRKKVLPEIYLTRLLSTKVGPAASPCLRRSAVSTCLSGARALPLWAPRVRGSGLRVLPLLRAVSD